MGILGCKTTEKRRSWRREKVENTCGGVSGGRPGRVVDAQAQRFQGSGTYLEQVSGKISRNCQRCSSSTSYQGRVVASILSGEAGWARVVPAQPLVHGNVVIATVQSQAVQSFVAPGAGEGGDRAEVVCSVCD